jgi:tRNA C32,U32 (ribose-2'-O)-methylase TrmJ
VVLVRPARAANVAAACRALKNMGLGSLAIVGAPAGLDQPEARALAYGAWDVLDAAVPGPPARGVAGAVAVAGTSAVPIRRPGPRGGWLERRRPSVGEAVWPSSSAPRPAA